MQWMCTGKKIYLSSFRNEGLPGESKSGMVSLQASGYKRWTVWISSERLCLILVKRPLIAKAITPCFSIIPSIVFVFPALVVTHFFPAKQLTQALQFWKFKQTPSLCEKPLVLIEEWTDKCPIESILAMVNNKKKLDST